MSNIRKEIRESFSGLSKEEILAKLLNSGFNVKEGNGEITIRDSYHKEDMNFKLQGNYTLESKIGSGKTEEYAPRSYSFAS
ncbi:hypothetical protein [Bacillus sp. AK128]